MTPSPAVRPAAELSLRGNPSHRDITAILIALSMAAGASSARPAPPPADPDDPWGTPELILRRQQAAISTLPSVAAGPSTAHNPEGTPR